MWPCFSLFSYKYYNKSKFFALLERTVEFLKNVVPVNISMELYLSDGLSQLDTNA